MAITRWDPFQDAVSLRGAMDRLFEQSFVRPNGYGFSDRAYTPPMDVYVDDDDFVVEMALPGLAPDAVNISVLGNQVTISGEYAAAPEGRQYLLRERTGGGFERTVTLPTAINSERVEAHYEHGLLRLTVPKAETAKPKRISLNAGK
jgi:HSP20 family protein